MNLDEFQTQLDKDLSLHVEEFNRRLELNSLELIKKITQQIDMIEEEFDKIG